MPSFISTALIVSSLTLQVLALPQTDQVPLHTSVQPRNNGINETLYKDLEQYARIADISYCIGATGIQAPFNCLSRCDDFPTFNLLQTFSTGVLLSDSAGYVARDDDPQNKRIIVVFRGTHSIPNAIADLSAVPQDYVEYKPGENSTVDPLLEACENCTVHSGFLQSWNYANVYIEPLLQQSHEQYPDYPLHFVGHSLGGAVALLGSLHYLGRGWDPVVTTFGEPRTGNAEFVSYVNTKFSSATYRRVTHISDPVPVLPPKEMNYKSHGNEIFIAKSDLPQSPDDVRFCEGDEDPGCSDLSDWMELWQMLFAHRDYFVRMGLCLPETDWSIGDVSDDVPTSVGNVAKSDTVSSNMILLNNHLDE